MLCVQDVNTWEAEAGSSTIAPDQPQSETIPRKHQIKKYKWDIVDIVAHISEPGIWEVWAGVSGVQDQPLLVESHPCGWISDLCALPPPPNVKVLE